MSRDRGPFSIRPEERKMVTLLAALMFTINAGMYVGAPGIESLFLTRFGFESLPLMYVILGVLTAGVTLLISIVVVRVSQIIIYRLLPLALAGLLVIGRILIPFDLPWLYPVLFLLMYLLFTLQNMIAWGTAGMVCDTRQAKRLFSLFAAGAILGSTAGGLATRALVPLMGAANLILVWAASLGIGTVLILLLTAGPRAAGYSSRSASGPARRRKAGLFSGVLEGSRYLAGSRFLRWFTAVAFLGGVLYFLLGYPFARAITLEIQDADRLAGFLGLFQGSVMGVGLLLSLLAANRLFARIGLMGSIWIFVLTYLAGFALVSLLPGLRALVGFRFVNLSFRLGVATTAYQAVFNIVPGKRRPQVRMVVEGVARQAGISFAGVLLILADRFLPPNLLYPIGAGAAAAAAVTVWIAGRAWRQALVEALRSGHPSVFVEDEEPFGGFRTDEAAVSALMEGIKAPDPRVRRASVEILGYLEPPAPRHNGRAGPGLGRRLAAAGDDGAAVGALVAALEDPDAGVRTAVLRSLGGVGATAALLEVSRHLGDPEPEVRLQALRELQRLAPYPRGLAAHLEHLLDDPAPLVRASGAAILLGLPADEHGPARRTLHGMLRSGKEETRLAALEACGEWGCASAYGLIQDCLRHPGSRVRTAAVAAAVRSDPSAAGFALVEALGDEERAVVKAAALHLGRGGQTALRLVFPALQRPELEDGALLALESPVPGDQAPLLRSYIRGKVDAVRRDGFLLAACRNLSSPALPVLLRALEESRRAEALRGIRAAGVLSDPGTVTLALENIASPDPERRANALETLDSIRDRELVRPLLRVMETREDGAGPRGAGPMPEPELVGRLADHPAPWVRACAALALGQDPGYRAASGIFAKDPDPVVREAAARPKERPSKGGSTVKTLPTLTAVERIVSLKQVPLFAGMGLPELKRIAAVCSEQSFLDGEALGHEGEIGEEMFIILSGEVRILVGNGDGGQVELARRGPSEYVGEMAILSREPRMATMVSAGEVRVLAVAQPAFEEILRQRPDASLAVMRVLCDRLREAEAVHARQGNGGRAGGDRAGAIPRSSAPARRPPAAGRRRASPPGRGAA